jgi:UDP-N-acetylmuramate dehydrogenase|tara:strand:+ start:1843 stop:2754 length:912 start_codon:yes stop_codon:yes gene_type:complete
MKPTSQINEIKKLISGDISFNESLSKHSWFNLGGPAKVIFRPKNLSELSIFLKKVKEFSKIKVLGLGSNTLIRDGGFDGVIIKFNKSFSRLSLFDQNTIIAGASALDKNVSKFAFENSLSGFEFLSCIPGTIGGGIRMNSGCYGDDISKILVSVQVMDLSGKIRVIYSSDIKFTYRGCDLNKDLIFISATFKSKKENKNIIQKRMDNLIEKKRNDQPSKIKTCGSTFKNPKNKKAWKLIKDSDCLNIKVGDACISKKHCNFFVNQGAAKSEDLEKLIFLVKKKVLNKTGINLELELQIIGEKL